MKSARKGLFGFLGVGAIVALANPAPAESLRAALEQAYRTNPSLTAARANQRAGDENVALAKADARPDLGVSASYGENVVQPVGSTLGVDRQVQAGAQVNVPLYSGGTVRNSIAAARLRARAGHSDLGAIESDVFTQVVAAYLDVIRDSAVVELNAQNVSALETNLRATQDRFEVGDLTRTDVAQSESRLALARAQLERARALLIASKENYIALVGVPPQDLETPSPLPGLPVSADAAVTTALADSPDIRAARLASEAARYDVRAAEGLVAPRISGFASGSYDTYLGSASTSGLAVPTRNDNRSVTVGATLSIPLYQGGRPAARQRQAIAFESGAIEQATAIERAVIAQTRASYASWQAAVDTIRSTQTAVDATALSLEGVRAENSVGTRTILDILNAEQEALNARVQLVTARRDAYVAAFSLLASMGRAEAEDLGLNPGPLYDPAGNLARVQGKIFDFDFDPRPAALSPTTAQTPAQTALPLPGGIVAPRQP